MNRTQERILVLNYEDRRIVRGIRRRARKRRDSLHPEALLIGIIDRFVHLLAQQQATKAEKGR